MARPTMSRQRSRVWLSLNVACVIAWGLASRRYPTMFPALLGKYPGDALWAWMVLLLWAGVMPAAAIGRLALYGLATAFAVEFSQLYHAPCLDAIRATTWGHLVLGSAFGWIDLCAYTVGVACAALVDVLAAWFSRRHKQAGRDA